MQTKKADYFPYEDIVDLPHPTSKIHRPMARIDRAAQFNPFAALTGYDDEIREAARFTCEKILLARMKSRRWIKSCRRFCCGLRNNRTLKSFILRRMKRNQAVVIRRFGER